MQIDPQHSQDATPPKDRFLFLAQVASVLQLSSKTVLRRMEDGTIPGQKRGTRWGCPESILMRWVRGEGDAMTGRNFLRQHLEVIDAKALPDNLDGRFVLFMEANSWSAVHEASSEFAEVKGRGETPAAAINDLLRRSFSSMLMERYAQMDGNDK
jgi:predicted DNA-binding transcriptional regulator AlpA